MIKIEGVLIPAPLGRVDDHVEVAGFAFERRQFLQRFHRYFREFRVGERGWIGDSKTEFRSSSRMIKGASAQFTLHALLPESESSTIFRCDLVGERSEEELESGCRAATRVSNQSHLLLSCVADSCHVLPPKVHRTNLYWRSSPRMA